MRGCSPRFAGSVEACADGRGGSGRYPGSFWTCNGGALCPGAARPCVLTGSRGEPDAARGDDGGVCACLVGGVALGGGAAGAGAAGCSSAIAGGGFVTLSVLFGAAPLVVGVESARGGVTGLACSGITTALDEIGVTMAPRVTGGASGCAATSSFRSGGIGGTGSWFGSASASSACSD